MKWYSILKLATWVSPYVSGLGKARPFVLGAGYQTTTFNQRTTRTLLSLTAVLQPQALLTALLSRGPAKRYSIFPQSKNPADSSINKILAQLSGSGLPEEMGERLQCMGRTHGPWP
jgi:hypothetical protein